MIDKVMVDKVLRSVRRWREAVAHTMFVSGPVSLRAPTNRHLWLGYLAGGIVVVLLLVSTLLSRTHPGSTTIRAEFTQAAGLRRGDTVDVAGIQVGTVGNERIDGDRIVVDLDIDPDVTLGPDAHAIIEPVTILGRMHVVLAPGNHRGLPGNRIPLSQTAVPYNLAKVVNDPTYKSQFDRIQRIDPNLLRNALNVLARQMGNTPQLTVTALDGIGELTKVINQRSDEVDELLKNMDAVSRLVDANRNNVLLLLTRGRAVATAIQQRQALIKTMLDSIASLSQQFQQLGIDNHSQLGPLIDNLDTMSQGLERNSANLNRLFQIGPPALRQFNNALGNGPYGDIYAPWGVFPDNWLCLVRVVSGCN